MTRLEMKQKIQEMYEDGWCYNCMCTYEQCMENCYAPCMMEKAEGEENGEEFI